MTNSNYSNLVERYLDGEMSKQEMADFEQMRSQDPLLNSEFHSQQEIINGVKAFRKAELKTRLGNVDVTPGLFQAAAGNTAVQATSVVLLTGAVFVGSYIWVESPDEIETIDFSLTSKSTELETSPFNLNIAEELPLVEMPNFDTSNKTEEIATVDSEEEVVEVVEATPLQPSVVAPKLADSGIDEDILPSVEEEITIKDSNTEKVSEVEIENITSTRKKFQYKFYNNKLFLYGDFNGIPYEILEINNRGGKKLFLFHDQSFYRISNNVTKSTPLRKVTNAGLIEELLILKENKSE